jgi:hypothetical protein
MEVMTTEGVRKLGRAREEKDTRQVAKKNLAEGIHVKTYSSCQLQTRTSWGN